MRGISTNVSPGEGEMDGDGESTTDGMRPWPIRVLCCAGSGRRTMLPSTVLGDGGAGILEGSQSKPGLTIKLMMSPSLTLYSCSSFPSANAFPLSRRRCTSAGGAPGSAASWALMSEIVSVDCTVRLYVLAGLIDLNVILREPAVHVLCNVSCNAELNRLTYRSSNWSLWLWRWWHLNL